MTEEKMKKCPFCGEEILEVAIKCKHCGSNINLHNNHNASKSNIENSKKEGSPKFLNIIYLVWAAGLLLFASVKIFNSESTPSIGLSDLEWSKRSPNELEWEESKQYCANLTESGSSKWRIPTISELRTIIRNCPGTEMGGECGVTDNCLARDCSRSKLVSINSLINPCGGCFPGSDIDGGYSRIGESHMLWSSSTVSLYSGDAWVVSFYSGKIGWYRKNRKNHVRCVR